MKYLFCYLGIMNLIAFIVYGIDKRKAIKQKWRIKESTLLTISLLGGSLGSLLAMFLFKHKTKTFIFIFLVPVFLILHIAGLIYLINL